MTENNRYDVIIIGSGAGGGTLAHKLAPTGKKILILERGGYVPRAQLEPPRRQSLRENTKRKVSKVEVAVNEYERLQGVFGARMGITHMKLGDEFIELTEYLAPRAGRFP